jgi:hypothetical protein
LRLLPSLLPGLHLAKGSNREDSQCYGRSKNTKYHYNAGCPLLGVESCSSDNLSCQPGQHYRDRNYQGQRNQGFQAKDQAAKSAGLSKAAHRAT